MSLPPETIAAYADGELEGDALRKVEAALDADASLRARVDAHRALKARLSAHFAPVAQMAVPEHLVRAARAGGEVIDFAAARQQRGSLTRRSLRWAGPALAASLVLALVSYSMSQRPASGYASGELAAALDRQLVATQSPQATVRILLSFRDRDGQFCRGYSSAAAAGIACRDDEGWKLRRTMTASAAEQGEFRQAGSPVAETLAAAQDLAQGPALDAEEELGAMRSGWRK